MVGHKKAALEERKQEGETCFKSASALSEKTLGYSFESIVRLILPFSFSPLSFSLILCCLFHLSFRKDVRLPVQLQRAMAAEAEAAREARAKVSDWVGG